MFKKLKFVLLFAVAPLYAETVFEQSLSGNYGTQGENLTFMGYKQVVGSITLEGTGEKIFTGQVNDGSIVANGGATKFNGSIISSENITVNGGIVTFNRDVQTKIFDVFNGEVFINGKLNNSSNLISNIHGGKVSFGGTQDQYFKQMNIYGGEVLLDLAGGNTNNGNITVYGGGALIFGEDYQTPTWWGGTIKLEDGAKVVFSGTNQDIVNLHVSGSIFLDFGDNAISTVTLRDFVFEEGSVVNLLNYNGEQGDFINIFGEGVTINVVPEPSYFLLFFPLTLSVLFLKRRNANK